MKYLLIIFAIILCSSLSAATIGITDEAAEPDYDTFDDMRWYTSVVADQSYILDSLYVLIELDGANDVWAYAHLAADNSGYPGLMLKADSFYCDGGSWNNHWLVIDLGDTTIATGTYWMGFFTNGFNPDVDTSHGDEAGYEMFWEVTVNDPPVSGDPAPASFYDSLQKKFSAYMVVTATSGPRTILLGDKQYDAEYFYANFEAITGVRRED